VLPFQEGEVPNPTDGIGGIDDIGIITVFIA